MTEQLVSPLLQLTAAAAELDWHSSEEESEEALSFHHIEEHVEGNEEEEEPALKKRKTQRFLRPSELFANDHRAAVRAAHPGFLDRAVRNRLSSMWRAADAETRAKYVEKAKIEREKLRALRSVQESSADTAMHQTNTMQQLFEQGEEPQQIARRLKKPLAQVLAFYYRNIISKDKEHSIFQLTAPSIVVTPPSQQRTDSNFEQQKIMRNPPRGPYLCQGKRFSLDGREWLVADNLDTLYDTFEATQLEQSQRFFRVPPGLVLLPTRAPKTPRPPLFASNYCAGGEIIRAANRLWYMPRQGEKIINIAPILAALHIPAQTHDTTQFLTGVLAPARIPPPAARQALIDELYLEQLALLPPSTHIPSAHNLQAHFFLLPATAAWPRPHLDSPPAVLGVLPPNIQPPPAADIIREANGRTWVNIQRAQQSYTNLPIWEAIAAFVHCDLNTIRQMNRHLPPESPLALLPAYKQIDYSNLNYFLAHAHSRVRTTK